MPRPPRSTQASSAPAPVSAASGSTWTSRLLPFVIVIILLIVGAAIFLKTKPSAAPSNSVQPSAQADAGTLSPETLVQRVSRLIVVKQEETPKIETTDTNDTVRLTWSDKVIEYSVSRDVLLSVLPLDLPEATSTSATSTTEHPTATSTEGIASDIRSERASVEVRNGTSKVGIAKTESDRLKAEGLNTVDPTNASVKTYEKTLIIQVSQTPFPTTLEALKRLTGGDVVNLPEGEKNSKTDFIVIIGADKIQ